VSQFLGSFFSIRNLCASHGLPDSRMIANDEMQMSNDEGMTKIRMQICVNLCNLRMIISVISVSSVVKSNFAA
jgi:hypothetical protein